MVLTKRACRLSEQDWFRTWITCTKGICGWVSIDTLDQHLISISLDTWLTSRTILGRHSADTQSKFSQHLINSQLSWLIGSISVAFSSPVYIPPQEEIARRLSGKSKLTMPSPCIQPWIWGRSAGSFPEQWLVIKPSWLSVNQGVDRISI